MRIPKEKDRRLEKSAGRACAPTAYLDGLIAAESYGLRRRALPAVVRIV